MSSSINSTVLCVVDVSGCSEVEIRTTLYNKVLEYYPKAHDTLVIGASLYGYVASDKEDDSIIYGYVDDTDSTIKILIASPTFKFSRDSTMFSTPTLFTRLKPRLSSIASDSKMNILFGYSSPNRSYYIYTNKYDYDVADSIFNILDILGIEYHDDSDDSKIKIYVEGK